jgi:hypothetical protein
MNGGRKTHHHQGKHVQANRHQHTQHLNLGRRGTVKISSRHEAMRELGGDEIIWEMIS